MDWQQKSEERKIMNKKRIIVLGICVALVAAYLGLNGEKRILVDGKEMRCQHIWGTEYLLVDDFLKLNYEVVLEDNILSVKTADLASNKKNPLSIPYTDDLHILINGCQIQYKEVDGAIGIKIDDLCELDDKTVLKLNKQMPVGMTSHVDTYYSAFNSLGYSPYRFKKNDDGSIVSLHENSIVECDRGYLEVDQICELVSKTEMQGYFSLKTLAEGLGATYEIQGQVLTFSKTGGLKEFYVPDIITNYTILGYPVLFIDFDTSENKKISAYIDRGILKVNGKEFAEVFGYSYEEVLQEDGMTVVIKGDKQI